MKLISCDESVLDKDFMILLPEAKREQIEKEVAAKKIRKEKKQQNIKENERKRKQNIYAHIIASIVCIAALIIYMCITLPLELSDFLFFVMFVIVLFPFIGLYIFIYRIIAPEGYKDI